MGVIMKTALGLFVALVGLSQAAPAPPPILGRWDLTVHEKSGDHPSWLEVRHSGTKTLVGQFTSTGGSARPISLVQFKDNEVRFEIPPQWERGEGMLVFAGRLEGDQLKGTIAFGSGQPAEFNGVRAPSLERTAAPAWDKPITLFNGKDLSGWHPIGNTNQWEAADGVLRNKKGGANLITDRTFTDFKLHIEFKYPAHGNSGVYLRGRYEVQVADLPREEQMEVGALGAVYGFLAPNQHAAKGPDEWQSFDVTLVGRRVTVALNGKTIICDAEIPGVTGGALDSKEGEPGPIYLQGDHGPVEFRNITITPAK
jgi:3-keto-disaccharide hydrolase